MAIDAARLGAECESIPHELGGEQETHVPGRDL